MHGLGALSAALSLLMLQVQRAYSACGQDTNGVMAFGTGCNYMCHCKNATEQCDDVSGECTSGCAGFWMGPGCQYRDLAKTEVERQKHIDNVAVSYSYLATDGDLTTCSRTAEPGSYAANVRKTPPWWRVWLDKKELIIGLVIITESGKEHFFKGFSVYVEEANVYLDRSRPPEYYTYSRRQTCYTHDGVTPLGTTINVTCDVPILDNHVRIELATKQTQLVLCDVRIYGGRNLAYGRQANQSPDDTMHPASRAVNDVVDDETCTLNQDVAYTWWSVDLNQIYDVQAVRMYKYHDGNINHYKLETRIEATGDWNTLHVDAGVTPTLYLNVSTVRTRQLQISRSGTNTKLQLCEFQVFGDCPNYKCGIDCTLVCHCKTFPINDKISGVCSNGCEGRWTGSGGKCNIECSNDRWGPTCNNSCGHCLSSNPCDAHSGHCSGGCEDGYKHTDVCVTSNASDEQGGSAAVIAGSAAGAMILIAVVVVLAVVIYRKRRALTNTEDVSKQDAARTTAEIVTSNPDGEYESIMDSELAQYENTIEMESINRDETSQHEYESTIPANLKKHVYLDLNSSNAEFKADNVDSMDDYVNLNLNEK